MLRKLKTTIPMAVIILIVGFLIWPQNSSPATAPQLQALTKRSIDGTYSKISPVRREMLSHILPYIADQVFIEQKHKEYWIALIGVESAYNGNAVSSAGAVGLGQLLPQYKDDFAKTCNLGEVTTDDVRDDFTNAYLSACYFRFLIAKNQGSVPLALISYNAGPNSKDLRKAKNGVAPSQEPSAYTTKIWVKRDQITPK